MATPPAEPQQTALQANRKPKHNAQQEYIEAWMRDDDIHRRERRHHIEYDC